MAPTKVLNCPHGQALLFEYNQVQFAEGRVLREFTPSGSFKKSSVFISPNYCLLCTDSGTGMSDSEFILPSQSRLEVHQGQQYWRKVVR